MNILKRAKSKLQTLWNNNPVPADSAEGYAKFRLEMLLPHLIQSMLLERRSTQQQLMVVQVGANDGVKDDPVRDLLRLEGVAAVLIEPQPNCVALLQTLYEGSHSVRIVHAAVGRDEGELRLFKFENDTENDRKISVFCSPNEDHLRLWKDRLRLSSEIVSIDVPLKRLDQILRTLNVPRADVLITDTEGWDYDVLVPFIQSDIPSPEIIAYEKCNLTALQRADLVRVIKEAGGTVYDLGQDAIALFPK
jgi:FkbM family methyltransferase